MSSESAPNRTPLPWDATGLAGKRAYVLVDEPTDEIDNPADLPPGTKEVVIVSDEPTPHHTLFVHPPDNPERLALVVYDQLSLIEG
jgi:hypothetical protein